ncbi:J domain-containing protein [soil metagenome]
MANVNPPYKPRLVDIRFRPPKEGEDDVHTLKPGERRCEWPECRSPATARAPRSRQDLENHYHFCQPHAGEYNKRWNFFEGMSEGEQKKFREGAQTGHRPTWEFKASRGSREAAAFAAKFGSGAAGKGAGASDKFDLFGGGGSGPKVKAETRQLGKLEQRALAELDLEMSADMAAIRTRYLDLVKRFHPDTNGGDRSTEVKLQRVIRAYKALQKAKLA